MFQGGASSRRSRRRLKTWIAALACAGAALSAAAVAVAEFNSGATTRDLQIVPVGSPGGFRELIFQPTPLGEQDYIVRDGGFGAPGPDRADERTSMAYFAQLSDFQLADEESPARVEMLDPTGDPFGSAHRPWEAMEAQIDDAMIRQVNEFAGAGDAPVADGEGTRPAMDFSINTGDSADSQQRNETEWVNTLIEGGPLNPGTGIDPTGYTHQFCGAGNVPSAAEAPLYTGVQDYDDYDETQVSPPGGPADDPYFYDPDNPSPALLHSDWPLLPGLMDRAQAPFEAEGLDVPQYLAFGNHDALLQGSKGGSAIFEEVATGCLKPLKPTINGKNFLLQEVTPADVLAQRANNPNSMMVVPPDPDRQFVSKEQYKDIFKAGGEDEGHGFDAIDPAEDAGSNENAGYYSLTDDNSEVPDGVRMIALDTVAEGGDLTSSEGNIDDPQFRWLERELQEARDAGEVVMLYSHHAPSSMNMVTSDEAAGACGAQDTHGHDATISCDVDPRVSTPLHVGPGAPSSPNARKDLLPMLHRYPNVIAWIAGHSHVNKVEAEPGPDGTGFWIVRVAAEADWPQQARLLQLFDNHDGTLSLFGTIIDHESDAAMPGDPAPSLDQSQLASVGRTLAANDHQGGIGTGQGTAQDRNVELLVDDPRLLPARPPAATGLSLVPGPAGDDTTPEVKGEAEPNSTVTLYESGSCSGAPEASGTAAQFGSAGLTASVADGSTVQFTVRVTDAYGNDSDCSAAVSYSETPTVQAPAPAKPCPKGKVKKKGRCVKKKKGKGKKGRKKK